MLHVTVGSKSNSNSNSNSNNKLCKLCDNNKLYFIVNNEYINIEKKINIIIINSTSTITDIYCRV